jgi:hypothetical protein
MVAPDINVDRYLSLPATEDLGRDAINFIDFLNTPRSETLEAVLLTNRTIVAHSMGIFLRSSAHRHRSGKDLVTYDRNLGGHVYDSDLIDTTFSKELTLRDHVDAVFETNSIVRGLMDRVFNRPQFIVQDMLRKYLSMVQTFLQKASNAGVIDPVTVSWVTLLESCFFYLWEGSLFPSVSLTENDVLDFVSTSTPDTYLSEVRPPWDAFIIEIPDGVIPMVAHDDDIGNSKWVRYIQVFSNKLEAAPDIDVATRGNQQREILKHLIDAQRTGWVCDRRWWYVAYSNCGALSVFGSALSDTDLNSVRIVECDPNKPSDEADYLTRVHLSVSRIIVGVCVEAANAIRLVDARPKRPKGVNAVIWAKQNRTRPYKFIQNVKLTSETEKLTRDFISGRGSPTVQTIVRRHRKRVACGKGRQERRWVTIEPYKRGPKDAPIGIRSHEFE